MALSKSVNYFVNTIYYDPIAIGALNTNDSEAIQSTLPHRAAKICLQSPKSAEGAFRSTWCCWNYGQNRHHLLRKFGANCSKCQRSTEQQQSIKCFKIHSKDLLQNNDFHITSSIFLLSSVLVFYFFLILFFNSIVYRFFIARIFGVLPEYFRDWGGCRPPRPPGSYAYDHNHHSKQERIWSKDALNSMLRHFQTGTI